MSSKLPDVKFPRAVIPPPPPRPKVVPIRNPPTAIVPHEDNSIGYPLPQPPRRQLRTIRKPWVIHAYLIGLLILCGLLAGFVVIIWSRGVHIPSVAEIKTSFNEVVETKFRTVMREELEANKPAVQPIQMVTMTPEIEKAIENKFEQLGLQAAKNSPIVVEKDRLIREKDEKLKAQSREIARLRTENEQKEAQRAELEDKLDLFQQKLEVASDGERDQIMKDAVANLSREDIEALMILEKISVRESSGRPVIVGPWVQMKIWVQKKDWKGAPVFDKDKKPVLILANHPGPFNPWNKVVKGVGFDRAWGPAQIMGNNACSWSQEATGICYTPEQLMKEPGTYRRVAVFQIKKLLKQYNHSVDDVLSVWHSGRPLKEARKFGLKDVNVSTVDYVEQVKKADTTDRMVWKNARGN